MVWDSVIGGVGSVISGILGDDSAEDQLEAQKDIAQMNKRMQVKFAKKGVRWRAKDVTKASKQTGLHRLSLLGVPGAAYSPVGMPTAGGGNELGQGIANAAAQLGAGISARRQEKVALDLAKSEIDMNKAQADAFRAQAVTGIQQAQRVGTGAQPGGNSLSPTADPQPALDYGKPTFDPTPGKEGTNVYTKIKLRDGREVIIADPEKAGEAEQDLYLQYKDGTIVRTNMNDVMRNITPQDAQDIYRNSTKSENERKFAKELEKVGKKTGWRKAPWLRKIFERHHRHDRQFRTPDPHRR